MNEKIQVIFHGRVQGVGFRYNTQSIARRFDVQGTVRNCSNGTVELVAEGEKTVLLKFLAEIQDHFQAHIEEAETNWSTATGKFTSFQILR